jgi:glutamate racemase
MEIKMCSDNKLTQTELMTLIIGCTNFAAIKHSQQRRCNKEQTPYINHPIGDIFQIIRIFNNI